MAFISDNLVCTAHGAGKNKIFHYFTNDLITEVDDSGYFNSAYALFEKGDFIHVSGDLDGTPANVVLTVNSSTGATTVTTVAQASVTLALAQPIALQVNIPAIGTAETIHTFCGVPSGYTGTVSRVAGVSHTNGAGSGGTSTITVTVPTTGAIATLPFAQDYTAGTLVEDATITAHTALTSTGVITIATDGTGSHTDSAQVFLEITLTKS